MPSAFEKTLADLQGVQCSEAGPEIVSLVRKAVASRHNLLAAKAASLISECGWRDLAPELKLAFSRFLENPVKSDPQCWAKNAICAALARMELDEPEIYIRGLRHTQFEPVWGGTEDSAGPLRGQCALALAQCASIRDSEVLLHLTDVLADHDKSVRIAAAKAVASVGCREGAMLLRLRVVSGEREPEVVAALFAGLLELDRPESIRFIGRFLGEDSEMGEEAALALGLTHDEEALELLRRQLSSIRNPDVVIALLRGIALSRLAPALDLLIDLIEADGTMARPALEALSLAASSTETRQRIERAVTASGRRDLFETFNKQFPL